MQLTSLSLALTRAGLLGFDPISLFAAGEVGAWYDPSDLGTLFTDAAGTTPVTAVEQPVGLMLDKSKGLVLGPELVTNGDFSQGTTGWTAAAGWSIGSGVASCNAVAGANFDQSITTVAGTLYVITYSITSYTSGAVFARFTGTVNVTGQNRSAIGTYTEYIYATSGNSIFRFRSSDSGFVGSIDNISVRELPGNHAFQTTAASRPVLSARVNLLTKTEQFDDAAWTKSPTGSATYVVTANQTTAPDGTNTADLVVLNAVSGSQVFIEQAISATINTAYTGSFSVKARSAADIGKTILFRQMGAAGYTNVTLSADWQRVNTTETAPASASLSFSYGLRPAVGGSSGEVGFYIWGADLRVANDGVGLPPYQRVNTSTDYDTTGFPLYLRFDGVDDFLVTNSINFTATDKMTVFAGVRKLSDAVTNTFFELGPNSGTTAGTFGGFANLNGYRWRTGGSVLVDPSIASGYVVPITNTLTGIGDISGDSAILRINGTQVASSTSDQGTGNYGNYPLYIGRRGGSSLPFNGRLHSLIVRGAQSSTAQIEATETYVNGKTKAY